MGLYVSAVLGARTGMYIIHVIFTHSLSLSLSHSDVGSFKCANEEERKEMDALLRSDLWKTLLRGGFQIGKLTRSLSGAYVSMNTAYINIM